MSVTALNTEGEERTAPEPWEDIDHYTEWTQTTWVSGGDDIGLALAALGLAGETGEVVEVVKKDLRDGLTDRVKLIKELGDVIYYWARLCHMYDISPTQVLRHNVEKLTSRVERGVINGAGDDR